MPGWMKKGYAAATAEAEEEKKRIENSRNKPFRFYLPDGKSARVTFVDGADPIVYREHNFQKDGSWRNWETCIQGLPGENGKPMTCPLCRAGNKAYVAAAYTVIDHSEWKDKKNQIHKDEVRLFVAKAAVMAILKKQHEKRGLPGSVFEITRSGDKSPSTGNQFDFEEKVNLAQEYPKVKPIDYEAALAPSTEESLNAKGSEHTSDDEEDAGGGGDTDTGDDEIPF